jgi:hypothetical protein
VTEGVAAGQDRRYFIEECYKTMERPTGARLERMKVRGGGIME